MRNRYLLTKFGQPEPWTPEEVQLYLAKVKRDIETPRVHEDNHYSHVWVRVMTSKRSKANKIKTQKPFGTTPMAEQKPEVETARSEFGFELEQFFYYCRK